MSRAAVLLSAVAGVAALAGCGGTKTVTVTRTVTTTRTVTAPASSADACTGSSLTGAFKVLAGSAGAGQIVYELTLTNVGQSACFVSGLPVAQLVDASGKSLPTHVIAARAGTAAAAKIVLAPGSTANARARFSPDVAGTGDQQTGACQPEASTLRVTPNGGGTLDVAIQPPTSVCEQGQLQFDLLASVS